VYRRRLQLLGEVDGDGDLDMVTASPDAVKYFERTER